MVTLLSPILLCYVGIPAKLLEFSCTVVLSAKTPLLQYGIGSRQGDGFHLPFEENLPKIAVSSTGNVFLEESFDQGMKGQTALYNV